MDLGLVLHRSADLEISSMRCSTPFFSKQLYFLFTLHFAALLDIKTHPKTLWQPGYSTKPANINQYFSHQFHIPGKAELPPPPSLERIYWPKSSGLPFPPTVNISPAYGNPTVSVYKLWQWFISRHISQPYKLSWALTNINKVLRGVSTHTGQAKRHIMTDT